MNQETITYLTNIVIGLILSALVTNYWRQRRLAAFGVWVLAAWILTVADILFAARQIMPSTLGRWLPTLTVTLGHAVLLAGTLRTAKSAPSWSLIAGVVGFHALGLATFVFFDPPASLRMVLNGLVWGGFSVTCGWWLRRSATFFWRPAFSPANAFFAHAIFHASRVGLALLFTRFGWQEGSAVLQVAGDLEVSFFMIALFVGLLVAHLQLQHEELAQTRAEMQTLSHLLPICAWCKKVRDDEGYWQQVEEYFERRSNLRFTHGVCVECCAKVEQSEAQ